MLKLSDRGFARSDRIERDDSSKRLFAMLIHYAQDQHVDVDAASTRLIDLSSGDWTALDHVHKHVVALSGNRSGDEVLGGAHDIALRTVERAGGC